MDKLIRVQGAGPYFGKSVPSGRMLEGEALIIGKEVSEETANRLLRDFPTEFSQVGPDDNGANEIVEDDFEEIVDTEPKAKARRK